MTTARRSMAGEVALVVDGGEGVGRDIARMLGAKQVQVVVAGVRERALGEVVGEITCGGGAARHFALRGNRFEDFRAAVNKALEAFGKLTFVVATSLQVADLEALVAAASPKLGSNGRIVRVTSGGAAPIDADLARAAEAALGFLSDASAAMDGRTFDVTL
jgi:short chain dehydrogenase